MAIEANATDKAVATDEIHEADKAIKAKWANKADVTGKPAEAEEAEADEANKAEAYEADAEANETGGAIVADEIKANVIDKIVAADEAILIDEVIAVNEAILDDATNDAIVANEANEANEAIVVLDNQLAELEKLDETNEAV